MNHKRKKARINTRNRVRMWKSPAWWNILFHARPTRRAEARRLKAVEAGADPDALTWPDGRKPHRYFW